MPHSYEFVSYMSDGNRKWSQDDGSDMLYDDVFGGEPSWPQVFSTTEAKPRMLAAQPAYLEKVRQLGGLPDTAACPAGVSQLSHPPPQPTAQLSDLPEPSGCTAQWEVKHPLKWSRDDVLDWLFSVASRREYGIDFLRFPAEAFCNATGAHLAAMTEADFVHRMGPDYGRLLHDLFWRTMSRCGWPSHAATSALPQQRHLSPQTVVGNEHGKSVGEMRPQRPVPQSITRVASTTRTMSTVLPSGTPAILTSDLMAGDYADATAAKVGLYGSNPYTTPYTRGRRACSAVISDDVNSNEPKFAHFGRCSSIGIPPSRRPSWPLQKQRQQQFLLEHQQQQHQGIQPSYSALHEFFFDRSIDKQRSTDSEDSGILSQSESVSEPLNCGSDSQEDGYCEDDGECCEDDGECPEEGSDSDQNGCTADGCGEAKRCLSHAAAGSSHRSAADAAGDAARCKQDGMSATATAKSKLLWEFVRDLLKDPQYNPRCIKWEDKAEGVFRFVQSDAVAKMWGRIKNNENMTYEKLSRAMRYYYKRGILERVDGKRLVYKFSVGARGWP